MSTGLGNVDICGVYITELFIILAKYSIIMQRETSSPSTQSFIHFVLLSRNNVGKEIYCVYFYFHVF